jgi:hypothetical protein
MMIGVPVASTGMLGTVRESKRCFWERADACSAPEAQKMRTRPSARICNEDSDNLILAKLAWVEVSSQITHAAFACSTLLGAALSTPTQFNGDVEQQQDRDCVSYYLDQHNRAPYEIANPSLAHPFYIGL